MTPSFCLSIQTRISNFGYRAGPLLGWWALGVTELTWSNDAKQRSGSQPISCLWCDGYPKAERTHGVYWRSARPGWRPPYGWNHCSLGKVSAKIVFWQTGSLLKYPQKMPSPLVSSHINHYYSPARNGLWHQNSPLEHTLATHQVLKQPISWLCNHLLTSYIQALFCIHIWYYRICILHLASGLIDSYEQAEATHAPYFTRVSWRTPFCFRSNTIPNVSYYSV